MKKQEGFTLIELMVVILIIGILVAIAVPVFFAAQSNAQKGACLDNLRTIDSVIMQYAAATAGLYPNGTSDLLGTYVRAPFPTCKATAALPYTYSGSGTNAMRTVCPAATPHTL